MKKQNALPETIARHRSEADAGIGAKCPELQSVAGMLADFLSQATAASEASMVRIEELYERIESAAMIDDLRALKSRVSECLESTRGEYARQRRESTRMMARLRNGLTISQRPTEEEPLTALDPVTGLPLRAQAEAAMETACRDGSRTYAGLFLLERMETIKTRFGLAIGEDVMAQFILRLSEGLGSSDKLFRWSPTSLLTLMERKEASEQVRREIVRFFSRRLEHTFDIGDRSVVLPITSTWIVVPLFESAYAQVLRKLDSFR